MGLAVSSRASPEFNTYSSQGVKFDPDGTGVTLSLLEGQTASGMGSKGSWLFGTFGAWIKLPAGNAAGTVATFYMASTFPQQCEFDFEFLGNNGDGKRKIHTNVFVNGKGGREQQIYFPGDFDPTADFHYYSFDWHENQLVFYVDGKPIRQFKNLQHHVYNGTYCDRKAMSIYLSIWDGSSWATNGGSIKINWTQAPFNIYYKNFNLDGCPAPNPRALAACHLDPHAAPTPFSSEQYAYLQSIRNNKTLVKYNYCTDYARYPNLNQDYPECKFNAM